MIRVLRPIAVPFSFCAAVFASSSVASAETCKNIRAEIDLTNGTITGNFGLNGTVAFAADGSGTPAPTSPPGSSVFSGILEITTKKGVLRLRETGMFSSRTGNAAGGVLASWGDSMSGTGFYQGATGDLFFNGAPSDGIFLVEVTGRICKP